MKDRELVFRCLAGDESAWELVYRKYVRLVAFVIRKALRLYERRARLEDVEDLTLEVFGRLLKDDRRALRELKAPFNLKAWLAVTARRCAIDLVKRRDRRNVSLDRRPGQRTPSAWADRLECPGSEHRPGDWEEMLGTFRRMPLGPKERLAARHFWFSDTSYAEVSRATGIAVNSVGPYVFRARRKIRSLFLDY